jgi:serine/threonine protein phosphatase 1
MRTFVLGDIHGGHRALTQCLERCDFSYAEDRLIFLGDATDGWSESPQVLEELLQIENFVYILGNHDNWFINWLSAGWEPYIWLSQGGESTIESYRHPEWVERRPAHLELLQSAVLCFVDDEDRLFVHGGFDRRASLDYQKKDYIIRDRQVFYSTAGVRDFKEVYIGHTPTTTVDRDYPLNFGSSDNVWRLDTGAGWHGRLSIMEVETRKFWQSDPVGDLYPDEEGRAQFHRESEPARFWRQLMSRAGH